MAETPAPAISQPALSIDDLVGRALGDFAIMRRIGGGGMGEVFLAEQLSLKRPVALKILRPELGADASYLRRFHAEAMAVAPINHPNIVSVITIGEEAGISFIAMEYVAGTDLRAFVIKRGPLDATTAVNILIKVAAAIEAAAEQGIIHRDIKPENVLLTRRGEVKVADFGLARQMENPNQELTKTGVTMGTPLYMSPEQIEGKSLDVRSDLYSLGITAYFMLLGQAPFRGETALAVAVQHLKGAPPDLRDLRPDLPHPLVTLVERLVAKSPRERPANAREVVDQLERVREKLKSSPDDATRRSLLSARSRHASIGTLLRDLTWTRLAMILAIALGLGGVAGAVAVRAVPRHARPVEKIALTPPDIGGVAEFRTASLQLLNAQLTADLAERRLRLWAVLLRHPGAENATIDAGVELFRSAIDARQYAEAILISDTLIKRDDPQQQLIGHLMRGIALAREGQPKASNDTFLTMLQVGRPTTLEPDALEWLSREYALALRQNAVALGIPTPADMAKRFSHLVSVRTFGRGFRS